MSGDPGPASDGSFLLGLDFGGTKIALATARSDGTVLYRHEIPTLADQGAERAVERAVAAGRDLIDRTAIAGERLRAVGVATMGVTLEHRVLMAPNVPGWDRLALPRLMCEGFSTDAVYIENDVKAAAAAELRWGALQGVDVGIYLNLGTGIATALIAGGTVLRGAHGAAGEIAYNLRHLHEEEGAKEGHAPLEEFAGGGAIAARVARQFGPACTPNDVFRQAESDPVARAFVEVTLTEVAFHVTNLAIALDPERIVVGGGLLRSKEIVLPRLTFHLQRFVPFPPEVRVAHFSLDAGLMGAIAVALD
jgi:glucokinase